MPMGPIQNPHIYWRVTGPPGTPTSTGESQAHTEPPHLLEGHRPIRNPHIYWRVTGPPGTPTSTGGSQAHLEPPHLLEGHRPIRTPTSTAGVPGPSLQDLMGPLPRDPGAA